MKSVQLTPITSNKYISIPIGLLLIYVAFYSGYYSSEFNLANIIYLFIGIIIILIGLEKEVFGILRYVKYVNNKIVYKRTPISAKQKIDVNKIYEIKFYGSKIYISSKEKTIVINIDLIKMKSRLELRDFFVANFKEKVIFEEQENIFVERYQRKLKKIEEKQRLKNGK